MVTREASRGPAHLLRAEVTHSYRTDFARRDGLRHQVHQRFNTQQSIGEMDVVQIHCLLAQAAQTGIFRAFMN